MICRRPLASALGSLPRQARAFTNFASGPSLPGMSPVGSVPMPYITEVSVRIMRREALVGER